MEFFYEEILNGLEKIPTTNSPGLMIVTGKSQAVFTGKNSGDTFLAACKYGKGKIFASAHDCYLDWLISKESELIENFMSKVKIWLTGELIEDSKIIDFYDLIVNNYSFDDYKLIKWHHDFDPSMDDQNKLLKYIENGGSVFCGTTPWGYLQIYSDRKLEDMQMHNFLKKHAGIIYLPGILDLPNEIRTVENKAKYSNFDFAIERIQSNPKEIELYNNTISNGLQTIFDLNLISYEKVNHLKNLVCENANFCCFNIKPNENNPIENENEKNMIKLLGSCLNFTNGEKAPGVIDFPGDFQECPKLLQNKELEIESSFAEWISTGYYLPAGVNLIIKVLTGDVNNWLVRIGAHSDDLSFCDSFKRWPCISIVKNLAEKEMNFFSPYGGLIYFESIKQGQLKVELSNVVESPFFDLKNPNSILNWHKNRRSPGLWAELAGEHIIFTTPSSCIRHIENPIPILKFWDSVVRTHHECRGTLAKDHRRERVVNDRQPSCGYMHSGYPIVTHLDCCQKDHNECIFDLEKLKLNGNWGLFHELGHNLQRSEWTFDGAVEVTVNIFSMHATQFIIGQDVTEQAWLGHHKPNFKNYFSKTPTYQDWQNDLGIALVTFAQLIKHFGWSSMKKFLKDYEYDRENHPNNMPRTDQDKIDQWVLRYSKIVSRNIKPQFNMFGLPVSEKVDKELSHLEPWLPVEEKDANLFFSIIKK